MDADFAGSSPSKSPKKPMIGALMSFLKSQVKVKEKQIRA